MEINIQSLHFTPHDELSEFVHKRVEKLAKLNKQILTSNVILKIDKSKKFSNKVCEVRLIVPGNDMFAKKQRKSFEEAILEVVNALERQLRKKKTQYKNKRLGKK